MKKKWIILMCYLAIYLIWGANYFFSKQAVATIPAYYVVFGRCFIGSFFIIALVLFFNRLPSKPTKKEILASAFIGCLFMIGGSGLVTVAIAQLDSYLAALLICCIPITVAVLDRLILKRKISKSGAGGICLGILGVGILLYNGQGINFSWNINYLVMCLAIITWSLGTTLSSKLPVARDHFINMGIQFITVSFISLFLVQFFHPLTSVHWQSVTLLSFLSVLYVAVFGGFAFICYNYLIKNEPNYRVVTYTFVNPLIAILIGLFVGGETAVQNLIPGTFFIFLGLMLLFYGKVLLKLVQKLSKPWRNFPS